MALKEVAGTLEAEGMEAEIFPIGAKAVQGCIACRRGGASVALDRLNKYFSINNMPVVNSQYWNIAYGSQPGEAARDAEGMQTMRTLGRNMAERSEDSAHARERARRQDQLRPIVNKRRNP